MNKSNYIEKLADDEHADHTAELAEIAQALYGALDLIVQKGLLRSGSPGVGSTVRIALRMAKDGPQPQKKDRR